MFTQLRQPTISDDETANEMNRYFSTVFIAEDNDNHPYLPFKTPFKLNIVQVSSQFVLETLLTLPLRTSAGPDDIPNEFFSKAAYTICDVLTRFFRFLFEHGILPSEWRLANVTPIFKKGNRNLCSNYRPISLTCTCCKIAERVVKDCILSFLYQHDLISSSQHGFLTFRSCLSSLLYFLEIISDNVDQGIDVSAIYIDFAKAFDSVHQFAL